MFSFPVMNKILDGGANYKVLITLASFICFYNSLENDLVHDDIFAIKNNKDIRPETPLWNIFANDFWGRNLLDPKSHKSYRPLCTLTFRLNYALFGMDSFWFHLVNLILHALVCNVLFCVLQMSICMDAFVAFLSVMLFATHPIHVEAVTGVVGRADVLSCLFGLLAFYNYMKLLERQRKNPTSSLLCKELILVLFFGSSSLFIKEHSVMVFVILIGYDIFTHRYVIFRKLYREKIRNKEALDGFGVLLKRIGTLIFALILLFQLRMYLMNYTMPTFKEEDNPASFSPHLQTRFLTYLYLLVFNLKLLLSPMVLSYDWQIGNIQLVESLTDPRNLETLLMIIIFVSLFVVILKNWFSEGQKIEVDANERSVVAGLLFFIIPFLPASNFLFRVGFVVAERILYIPSIGFVILVGTGFDRVCKTFPYLKKTLYGLFVVTLLSFSLKTVSYNKVWKSRETLFRSGIKTLPHNAKAHYNYANFLKDQNQTLDAIKHYKQAVRLYPPHASSHNNIGVLLQETNPEEAEYYLEQALHYSPGHYRAMLNLANIHRTRRHFTKAYELLEKCVSLDPSFFDAKLLFADTLHQLGRAQEALNMYKSLLREDRDHFEVNHNYAAILQEQGHYDQAIKIYTTLLEKAPKSTKLLNNIAIVYQNAGQFEMAVQFYERAIQSSAQDPKAYENLSALYYKRAEFQKSKEIYDRLIKISSSSRDDHLRKYAIVLFALKKHNEAVDIVEENIRQKPSDIQSHRILINFLVDLHQNEKAKVAIQRALKIFPGDQQVSLFKANLLRNLKEYEEASKIYKILIKSNPKNMDAIINLGTIYHLQGNYDDAMLQYQNALQVDSKNEIALQNVKKLQRLKNKKHI